MSILVIGVGRFIVIRWGRCRRDGVLGEVVLVLGGRRRDDRSKERFCALF